MAEDTTTNDESLRPPDEDWFLSIFVRAANEEKGSVSVTLWVGGAMISGLLVGVSEYLDGIAEEFDQAAQTANAESLGEAFRNFATSIREDLQQRPEAEDPPPPVFIHLKDARTYAPGGAPIPANRGVWWRGRLSEVAAWSFGELRAER